MEKPEIFYMVYLEGAKSPSVKHPSRLAARQEAHRLTEKTKIPAYVLRAIEMTYEAKVTRPTYEIRNISLVKKDY